MITQNHSDDLFAAEGESLAVKKSNHAYGPLAAQLRPRKLNEFYGQLGILSNNGPLRQSIESGKPHSMVFWGPPGVGKTTLAMMVAEYADAHFVTLSAVTSGIKDVRQVMVDAKQISAAQNRKTILFVDEVHRFNKAQQDSFLPFIEDGTVIFIGATTENPGFELNSALLSRCKLYVLNALEVADIEKVINRALAEQGRLELTQQQLSVLVAVADGDARRALNFLEMAMAMAMERTNLDDEQFEQIIQGQGRRFDKRGDYFYDQISALHKSVRGSSPDGALYWLCRMLDGGCDPLYVARRIVRMASEDIGNADPRALEICLNACATYERLGSPEGELTIAQAVIYLACAPKSNGVYVAYKKALKEIASSPSYEVPVHLRNAPTSVAKDLDFGKDYRYAHDEDHAYAAGESYLPTEMADVKFYEPVNQGLEIKIAERLKRLSALDKAVKK